MINNHIIYKFFKDFTNHKKKTNRVIVFSSRPSPNILKYRTHCPYLKYLYKNYTNWIQKWYKTLNLYIFFTQRLYKPKFCMIMNVQKMYIKFLHIYKKCRNCIYKTYTKFRLKTGWNLKCMFFVRINNVQIIQNLYN